MWEMFPGSLLITCPITAPSPSHNDGTHTALVAASVMLVEDGLGPEHFQDSSKVLGVEGGQFVRSLSVIFQHSEP